MDLIDLTHPMTPAMPVYPGTPPPGFSRLAQVEREGYAEMGLSFTTHTGTHLDAPAHMIPGGLSLDGIPPERFVGPAYVLHLPEGQREIGVAELLPHADAIGFSDFLLIRTGWDRFWGAGAYFRDFPVLTPQGAGWLTRLSLKGVGVDAVSVDRLDDTDYPVHHILLASDMLIVENLTGLDRIPESGALFSCLPLKITGGDGSPVRAAALILP